MVRYGITAATAGITCITLVKGADSDRYNGGHVVARKRWVGRVIQTEVARRFWSRHIEQLGPGLHCAERLRAASPRPPSDNLPGHLVVPSQESLLRIAKAGKESKSCAFSCARDLRTYRYGTFGGVKWIGLKDAIPDV